MNQSLLLKQLGEISFAMDDALLFLDTHPNDSAAAEYYRNIVSLRKQAMDAYVQQYGPLLANQISGYNRDWVTERWPWEGGY